MYNEIILVLATRWPQHTKFV